MIADHVKKYGPRKWDIIAQKMNRLKINISATYHRQLYPKINNLVWDFDQDILLIKLYLKHGAKWKEFRTVLYGRCAHALRKRFFKLLVIELEKMMTPNYDSSKKHMHFNQKT